jgi:hypothetical protein
MFRIARDGTYLEVKGDPARWSVPTEEIVGRTCATSCRPTSPRSSCGRCRPAAQGVQTVEYRLTIDGEQRDFEARLVPSGDDEVVVIVRDFTDRTRLEDGAVATARGVQREQEFTRASSTSRP